VTPLAWSLDHVGVFARTVADAALALEVLAGHDDADPFSAAAPALAHPTIERPRLGIPRWLYEDKATTEVRDHLEQSASRFEREGATVEEISPPASAKEFRDAHAAIMRVEAAAYHRERYLANTSGYRPYIRRIVEEGLSMPAFAYARALRIQREFRRDLTKALHGLDALLLPVAPSTAPKGLDSTGDPVLCVPGSLSGLPAISVPSGLGSQGLPLAIQLLGHAFLEDRLLAAAKWCAGILHFEESPQPERRASRASPEARSAGVGPQRIDRRSAG
jgi:Asp-tRNA(Asn)/Glu-tRNA(Gln) amidotransferase A subunit family amidase